MSRRIEIELTSARPDGSWTWRAAGAREPKGILDGGLLPDGAKPGDVLKAEANFELDGIAIASVTAPKADNRREPQRIEIIGSGPPDGPGVTTQLVGRRSGDRRRDRGGDDERRDRSSRPQGGRGRREGTEPARRDSERRHAAGGRGPEGPASAGPGERRTHERREGRRGPRPVGEHPADERRDERGPERRSRVRRLNPGSVHRKTVMESLPPEQQPVAEQLLRGGIPAVRTAMHLEREKAQAEGRPAPNSEEILALAESLLPRLRAAEWRDRAEAAVASLDSISMRDLRSVVAGADMARDEESRQLGSTLRQALEARVSKLHQDWASDITSQLEAGRVVRAVRLSGRGPDPSARLDAGLSARLVEAAGATLAPTTPPDLWMTLLEAVVEAPFRRSVVPVGLPADPPAELKRAAHQASGSVPALAKLLGVTIPPPPAPTGPRRRPAGRGGEAKPAAETASSADAEADAVPPEAGGAAEG